MSAEAPLLSVVVPVLNEAENVGPLVAEIRAAVPSLGRYEIVFVDDGSTDATVTTLASLRGEDLRVLRHHQRCGQSTALLTGVRAARGTYIATLDGDGQNDPADIPLLWQAAQDHQRDPSAPPFLVCGWRVNRRDSWIKRRSSRIANAIRRSLLHDDTRDTGCSLKLYRRETFLAFPHFDHNHRFLCALMIRAGGVVLSVPVNHRPRLRGVSKYGFWDRLWVGIDDLWGVAWLMRRMQRPKVEEV
jgi:dolichol-phosphate mannosyltransferase